MYPCGFTGPASGAQPGNMTKTPGIMSEDELDAIAPEDIVNYWFDDNSQCIYQLYYTDNWAAWTQEPEREDLSLWFQDMGFKGTSLWALNYASSEYDDDYYYEEEYFPYVFEDIFNCNSDDSSDVCSGHRAIKNVLSDVQIAVNNVTKFVNNIDDFNSNYQAYVDWYKEQLLSNFTYWAYYPTYINKQKSYPVADNYFSCPGTCSDILQTNWDTGLNCFEPMSISQNFTFNQNFTFAKRDLCNYVIEIIDMDIPDDKKSEAIDNFNNYYSTNISTDVFQLIDSLNFLDNNGTTFWFTDSTILNVLKLTSNPLYNMTHDNINNIQNIINSIDLTTNDPYYINDILAPVIMFIEYSNNAYNINEIGKTINAQERKAKILEIINIVLSLFSLLTIAGGGLTSTVVSGIVDIIQLGVNIGLTGNVDPADITTTLIGIFAPIFSGIKITSSIDYLKDVFKISRNENDFKNIKNTKEYIKFNKERFRLCKI